MSGLRVEEVSTSHISTRLWREWDHLAAGVGSPFLSSAWLRAWTGSSSTARCVLARDEAGALVGGAAVTRSRAAGLSAAADVHTGEWTVCASDPAGAQAVWRHLASRGAHRVVLPALPSGPAHADAARTALREAGYLVTARETVDSPRLELPRSPDQVLGAVSRALRSQYRRREKALERLGGVVLRTTCDPAELDAFLRLEMAGWKSRRGTAIASTPATERLYRSFARAAGAEGWLRLQLLEAGGRPVAADLSCCYAGGVFMLKTAYDETLAELSPGLVLRGRALTSAVDDGLLFYDFLGGAEDYKLRWGAQPRRHVTVLAHRPPLGVVPHAYHAALRPWLKRTRQRAHARWPQVRSRAAALLRPALPVEPPG